MGSQFLGLDGMDVPKPPEVLAEGTPVFKEDSSLPVLEQGLTFAVKEDFSTHAEIEQKRCSRLEVYEDPLSSLRHAVHLCMDEQLPELVW